MAVFLSEELEDEDFDEDVSGAGGPGCSWSTALLGLSDLAMPDSSPPYDVPAKRCEMVVVGR